MTSILKAIDRAYARPPLSWTVSVFNWLAGLLAGPMRPLMRRHALRKQARLTEISIQLARIGLAGEAQEFTAMAAQWGRIAAGASR